MDLFSKLFSKKRIYLDYASLTPIDKRVICHTNRYLSTNFANASSIYKEGVNSKKVIEDSRKKIAGLINAHEREIFFTSGGTESNNIAILGAVENLRERGVDYDKMHILISVIEHSSIREIGNYLSGKGVDVEIVPVDTAGLVDPEEIKKRLKPNTVIVSIMTVNNEIGSIQPIREIAKIIRHHRSHNSEKSNFAFQDFAYPIFHTDASQAFLYEEINTEKFGVDLLTLDSSKVYGPRGMGLLYIRHETPISPIRFGGGQESGLRSGTENVQGIAGFCYALGLAREQRESEAVRLENLKDFFYKGLKEVRQDIEINGGVGKNYSPHILNIHIPKIDNEFFVLQLDANDVCISTKSSCLGDEEESYVLNAIGANSRESVRISFGRFTTFGAVKKALKIISKILRK